MDGSFEDFNFDEEAYEREQIFHNAVREYIVSMRESLSPQ